MDVEEATLMNDGIFKDYDIDIINISNISESTFQHLKEYCSFKVNVSEYFTLLKYPDLLDDSIIDILVQLAIRANNRNDHIRTFHFHRKYLILRECIKHGVQEFFKSLQDPVKSKLFFENIGFPPGYDDTYYDKLYEQYNLGDNLDVNRNRMIKFNKTEINDSRTPEGIISSHFSLFKATLLYEKEIDLDDFITQNMQIISDKYLLNIYNSHEDLVSKLLKQLNQRSIIIEAFFYKNNGIQMFFNWFNSMSYHSQLELLHNSFREVFESTGYSDNLTTRQKLLLCPELSDICALIANDALLLFELFNKVSFKRENAYSPNEDENVYTIENLETILKVILEESADKNNNILDQSYELHFTEHLKFASIKDIKKGYKEYKERDIKDIIKWILEKEKEYYIFHPAIIRLEWILEDVLISKFKNDKKEIYDQLEKKRDNFSKFETWFLIYRSRILQLFVMNLIEKCIYECTWIN